MGGCASGWDLELGEPWETKPQREMEPADQSLKGLSLAGDKKLLEVLSRGMTCSL